MTPHADPVKAARAEFMRHYQGRYGPFPAAKDPDVAQLWWDLVDQVPQETVSRLVESLAEFREGKGKPMLGELEHAVRALNAEKRQSSGTWERGPEQDPCTYCGDSGMLSYLAVKVGGQWRVTTTTTLGPLYSFALPCICTRGQEFPLDPHHRSFQEKAVQWLKFQVIPMAMQRKVGLAIMLLDLGRESWRNREASQQPAGERLQPVPSGQQVPLGGTSRQPEASSRAVQSLSGEDHISSPGGEGVSHGTTKGEPSPPSMPEPDDEIPF